MEHPVPIGIALHASASSVRVSASKLRSHSALISNTGAGQPCCRACTSSWSQYAPLTSLIVSGGRRHPLGGTFYEPTVIADATREMLVAREETFGPVAPVFRFEREEEAIFAANSVE